MDYFILIPGKGIQQGDRLYSFEEWNELQKERNEEFKRQREIEDSKAIFIEYIPNGYQFHKVLQEDKIKFQIENPLFKEITKEEYIKMEIEIAFGS